MGQVLATQLEGYHTCGSPVVLVLESSGGVRAQCMLESCNNKARLRSPCYTCFKRYSTKSGCRFESSNDRLLPAPLHAVPMQKRVDLGLRQRETTTELVSVPFVCSHIRAG